MEKFEKYLEKSFEAMAKEIAITAEEKEACLSETNLFTSFISIINGESDPIYLPSESLESLTEILANKLEDYNENKA